MGAGGKKKNESFQVAPGVTESTDPTSSDSDALAGWEEVSYDGQTYLTQSVQVDAYTYEALLNPQLHTVTLTLDGQYLTSLAGVDDATVVAHTEAALAGYAGITRCGACGQFMSDAGGHMCPETETDDIPILAPVTAAVDDADPSDPDPGDLVASPDFSDPTPADTATDDLAVDSGEDAEATVIELVPATEPTEVQAAVDESLAAIATLRDDWWHQAQYGYGPDEVAEYYQQLEQLNDEARAQLTELGASEDELREARKALGAANTQALAMLSEEDLTALGAANGFPHPVLVSSDAIAFTLNPAYADSDRIAKVHATAIARYEEMLATGTAPNGMTLADYDAATAALPNMGQAAATVESATPTPDAPPVLTATRMNDLQNRLQQILSDTDNFANITDGKEALEVIDAFREVSTAVNADNTDNLEAAKVLQSEIATGLNTARWRVPKEVLNDPELIAALEERLGMEGASRYFSGYGSPGGNLMNAVVVDSRYLGNDEGPYGGPTNLQQVQQMRAWETATLESLSPLHAHVPEGGTAAAWPDKLDSPEAVAQAAALAQGIRDTQGLVYGKTMQGWNDSYTYPDGMTPAPTGSEARTEIAGAGKNLIATPRDNIKNWASQQDLKQLREVATALGGTDMDTANRSQVTSYLRATVGDMKKGPDDVQAAITAANATKATKAAAQQAAKAAALANPDSPTTQLASATALASGWKKKPGAPQLDPPTMSFTDVVAMNAAAAQHMHASREPIPARMSAADVAAIPFTPAPNPGLGGAHSKSFHTDPGGTTWMHKPYPSDKNSFARSEAEAVASQAFTAGGIPAVPVYRAEVGGQVGALQPLIANTGTMSSSPATYTQADVDSVVRMHVGTWLVGDHDLHPANVLRTPGGGLVPIDQGQAFKNYGRDKLALDYHPNSKFGEAPPVWQSVYRAAQEGTLAPGVHVRPEVALTVIKEYEKMPDSQWRDMLRPMAASGAKHGAVWVEPMRKRAAKKHGITESQVSSDQVEEAFLDYATERKKTLRTDFGKFFTSEGWTHARTIFSVG